MFLTRRFYIALIVVILLLGSGYVLAPFFVIGQWTLFVLLLVVSADVYSLYRIRGIQAFRQCADRFSNGDENEVSIRVESSYPYPVSLEVIDEIPVIAVMAAVAEGTTVIKDAAELKVKETDRIETVTDNLKAMGADVTPTDDGMIIHGGNPLHGTSIHTLLDHRIAMAFSIAALVAEGNTKILDSKCVDVSYPTFYDTFEALL